MRLARRRLTLASVAIVWVRPTVVRPSRVLPGGSEVEVEAGRGGTEQGVEIDGAGETSTLMIGGSSALLKTLAGGFAEGPFFRHSRGLTGTGNRVRVYSAPGTFMTMAL